MLATSPGAQPPLAEAPGDVGPGHAVFLVEGPARAHMAERILMGSIAGVSIVLLGLAAWLQPSAAGLGTHEQLGLPPCGLYEWTGLPCPSCGMTTAFAHTVRGQLLAAARAQPVGLLLALGAIVGALGGGAGALFAIPLRSRLPEWLERRAGGILLVLMLLGWVYKIVAVKSGWR